MPRYFFDVTNSNTLGKNSRGSARKRCPTGQNRDPLGPPLSHRPKVPLSCIEPQSLAQNRRTFGIKIPPRSESLRISDAGDQSGGQRVLSLAG
jgi:hypothetical protein